MQVVGFIFICGVSKGWAGSYQTGEGGMGWGRRGTETSHFKPEH